MANIIATIVVAVLSLIGTCVGSIAGIMTAQKMTNYRIEQLEKKVDKMIENTSDIGEKVVAFEQDQRAQWKSIDEIKDRLKTIESELRKEHS